MSVSINYPTELNGAAFSQALVYHKAIDDKATLEAVLETAKKIGQFFYIPDKDWEDTGLHILKLAEDIELAKVEAMIAHLSMIQERRAHKERANPAQLRKSIKTAVGQA